MSVTPETLLTRFDAIVERSPNQLAIISHDRSITFRQLDQWSNQIAHYLVSKLVHPGDVIAIFNDKSTVGYALMLASLKVGATYVNLDPTAPRERTEGILKTASPRQVFRLAGVSGWFVEVDSYIHFKESVFESKDSVFNYATIDDTKTPAYLMFTSGSTGKPKGAIIARSSVLNFVRWIRSEFSVNDSDRFSGVNPIYFDNSVFDFYGSIFNGCTLLAAHPDLNQKPSELVQFLEDARLTIWFSVPSFLIFLISVRALSQNSLGQIRAFIFGGEGYPKPQLKRLFNLFSTRARFFNVYGPTECTCICSNYEVTAQDLESLEGLAPLGKIGSDFDYRIVNESGADATTGELWLYGPNVGLGYFADPDRTQASFGFEPARHYRCGDLVEIRDGLIWFKGRKDFQIKHMGFRIELEDIEAQLNSLPGVIECGVIYVKDALAGKIIAFVAGTIQPNETIVLDLLRNRLPTYMVPKRVEFFETLPKNPNGKIDRVALTQIATTQKRV